MTLVRIEKEKEKNILALKVCQNREKKTNKIINVYLPGPIKY